MSDKAPPNQSNTNGQKQRTDISNNKSQELTAEWTVRAKLIISRLGEKVTKEFHPTDPNNPIKVIYKWTNLDDTRNCESNETLVGSRQSSPAKGKQESFHSTTSTTGDFCDSAFDSLNPSQHRRIPDCYGTRCRSTCNIILSAVADFIPNTAGRYVPEEPDPFVFNTTASYTLSPDKMGEDANVASQNFASGKILALRDAFSQTSDTETKYVASKKSRQKSPSQQSDTEEPNKFQRKFYEHRRYTESFLRPTTDFVEEGNTFMPSTSISPSQTFKSTSLPRIPPLPSVQSGSNPKLPSSEQPKKPRTVHIDVYCTGSDEDDEDDGDDESSASSDENQIELESNSTPQTVLDTEQMYLRHHRMAGVRELPRRLGGGTHSKVQNTTPLQSAELNIGHAITKCSTAEEVNESKQMLFKKHIGDHRISNKTAIGRSRILRKESSEDCVSSNYPNSSRSTMRDVTSSSISSVMASQDLESSWKETEPETIASVAKSDSFEYDNKTDRFRIRQMERFWSMPEGQTHDAHYPDIAGHQSSHLQPIIENLTERSPSLQNTPQIERQDTIPSESENYSETDNVFFAIDPISPLASLTTQPVYFTSQNLNTSSTISATQMSSESQSPNPPICRPTLQRWRSETRDILPPTPPPVDLMQPISVPVTPLAQSQAQPFNAPPLQRWNNTPEKRGRSLYTAEFNKSESESSSRLSNISGYTMEYLDKANRFGNVILSAKKPGHHIGPTKNPNCSCDHCRRWMAERFEVRGRAFSTGDSQPRVGAFLLKRNN